jgi:hypothetical protein
MQSLLRAIDCIRKMCAHLFTCLTQISKSPESVKVRRPIYFVRTVRCGYLLHWGRNPFQRRNESGRFERRYSPGIDQFADERPVGPFGLLVRAEPSRKGIIIDPIIIIKI